LIFSVAQKHRCVKFKAKNEYPQLIYWYGPGAGFKLLGKPTIENLDNFFERKRQNPIRPLRDFLEEISLVNLN